jgi:hypothetical protein
MKYPGRRENSPCPSSTTTSTATATATATSIFLLYSFISWHGMHGLVWDSVWSGLVDRVRWIEDVWYKFRLMKIVLRTKFVLLTPLFFSLHPHSLSLSLTPSLSFSF